jgi:hypothetical protein
MKDMVSEVPLDIKLVVRKTQEAMQDIWLRATRWLWRI